MHVVEAKLAEWHEIYKRLTEARRRLAAESVQPATSWRLAELEKEVARLKTVNDDALHEVHVLLERRSAEHAMGFRMSTAKAFRSDSNATPPRSSWDRRLDTFQQGLTARWAGR